MNKAVGQITKNLFPKATQKIFVDWKLSKLGSLSLLMIIWQIFDQAFETGAFDSVKGNNIVFMIFKWIVLYALWTVTCFLLSRLWLDKADTMSCSRTTFFPSGHALKY